MTPPGGKTFFVIKVMSFVVTGSPPGHRNINKTPGGWEDGRGGVEATQSMNVNDFPSPIFGIPPLPKL